MGRSLGESREGLGRARLGDPVVRKKMLWVKGLTQQGREESAPGRSGRDVLAPRQEGWMKDGNAGRCWSSPGNGENVLLDGGCFH